MKTKSGQHNTFVRIIKTPFRALCKARDFYVRSMMGCANSNIVGLQGTAQTAGLPRSFSVGSARSSGTDEDYWELVRAASARNIGSRINLDAYMRQERTMKLGSMPPRSVSVAMARIDEDGPCYFGENDKIGNVKSKFKYPRSKSHAVTRIVF